MIRRVLLIVLISLIGSEALADTSTTATTAPARVQHAPPPLVEIVDAGLRHDATVAADAVEKSLSPPRPRPDAGIQVRRTRRRLESGAELLIDLLRARGNPRWVLLLIIILFALVHGSTVLGRHLLPEGVLPRINRVARIALRLVTLGVVLWFVVLVSPLWMGPALPWVLLAVVVLIVWSARDILPDIVAGAVIRVERRVRVGTWVRGDGFRGVVDRIGTRGATLRDASDRYVEIPNRLLLRAPVVRVTGTWTTHDACVTVSTDVPADTVRKALVDAVLTSPWIPLEPRVLIRRDGEHPSRWWVRARLLDVRYAARFEGELLERTEEILGATPAANES